MKTEFDKMAEAGEMKVRQENIEIFLKELVDYFADKEVLNEVEMYLQERARKLSGDKINIWDQMENEFPSGFVK